MRRQINLSTKANVAPNKQVKNTTKFGCLMLCSICQCQLLVYTLHKFRNALNVCQNAANILHYSSILTMSIDRRQKLGIPKMDKV